MTISDERPPLAIEMMGGPYREMQPSPGEYHAGHGVTFLRLASNVMIRKWEKRDDGWHFRAIAILGLDSWVSVVDAMKVEAP